MPKPQPPKDGEDDEVGPIREKAGFDAVAATVLNERSVQGATVLDKRAVESATVFNDRSVQAASLKWERDQEAAREAARHDVDKEFLQGLLDATKGSIDRSRSAAQFVQQAAAAIVTLYAGILAVSFSATGRLLPIRGIFPAFFLALSVATATVYVSFLTAPKDFPITPPASDEVSERVMWRFSIFRQMVSEFVDRRGPWLRAAVVALAIGVLFLPAPFIALSAPSAADLTAYPWPSPPPVSNQQAATIESVLYTAQVAEKAAARQRAEAAQNQTGDLGLWVILSLLGLGVLVYVSSREPQQNPQAPGAAGMAAGGPAAAALAVGAPAAAPPPPSPPPPPPGQPGQSGQPPPRQSGQS